MLALMHVAKESSGPVHSSLILLQILDKEAKTVLKYGQSAVVRAATLCDWRQNKQETTNIQAKIF
jgi:hypothetical protein